ncbi:hypothetical protein ACHAWO_009238 [Cyclotella atomus]|uniref:Uncharacterized protein n=1 Tax=Cyclotella atomus TaxID=382360 RepID=A0ABD3NDY4_9STRA
MLFYFTECWDIWDDEDNETIVALASIAATNGDDITSVSSTIASNAPASYTDARENGYEDKWQACYEGFFDKLADEFAKVMVCDRDENCGFSGCGCGHHGQVF